MSRMKLLAADRDDYAKATADFNSVHFGPKAIAHGCHVLGWALGQVVDDGDITTGFTNARFDFSVPIGSEMELRVLERKKYSIRAGVWVGDKEVTLFQMWRARREQVHSD